MCEFNVITLAFQNNGKCIWWDHIEELYKEDSGSMKDTAGLYLAPRLKYEHVHLNSFSRMRVDLAAQVHVHAWMCSSLCIVLLNAKNSHAGDE